MPTSQHRHESQETALGAIARVVVARLRSDACPAQVDLRDGAPMIVQLDGPGTSKLFELVAGGMDGTATTDKDRWTVVRFDAWQHQRLASPWWWLVLAIDRQISANVRRDRKPLRLAVTRHRARDVAWRLRRLGELWIVAALVVAAIVLWILADSSMTGALTSVATVVTTLAGLALAVGVPAIKQVRRRWGMSRPPADGAVLRNADPMADLRDGYAFLLRTRPRRPVLVLVDNLDRCQADYVVDLLEGIQTLLRHPGATEAALPFVAFVVAADRDWLCESFLQRYESFDSAAKLPGQPFGEPFLEKIFDLELRLPTIPAAQSIGREDGTLVTCERVRLFAKLQKADNELAVRRIVCKAERKHSRRRGGSPNGASRTPPVPLQVLRCKAVERIGEIEYGTLGDPCADPPAYQCEDTHEILEELVRYLDAGARIADRIEAAYCVQRTTQFLGGHALERDEREIRCLGLWTILATRWPLLADHLAARPEDLLHLREGQTPPTADPELEGVFRDPAARQVAAVVRGDQLDPDDIRRYLTPISYATEPAPEHDASAVTTGSSNGRSAPELTRLP